MPSRLARAVLVLLLAAALPAGAGTLTGVVRNGTTGKPAAGMEVELISLQSGMEPVATTHSDAQGRYSFDRPEIGSAPMLVRVAYKDATYNQSVPPGRTTADIDIFEATATVKDLQITTRFLIVQPNGAVLLVGEEYAVRNRANPPATFVREFEFRIPEGATLSEVAAWGPSGMPVTQGTTSKGKNHFAVAFPLRPGENGFRISYQLPYEANRATVAAPALYPVDSMMVIAPPTMQVEGAGLNPAGSQQGFNVYARGALAAEAAVAVEVSGTAPPPQQGASAGGEMGSAETQGTGLQTFPNRLAGLQWALLGGLGVLFVFGTVRVWRKTAPAVSVTAAQTVAVAATPERPVASPPPATTAAAVAAQVNQAVHQSLDQIKDVLFRLELRRQAGTISEQEYVQQRAAIEQNLRELVKG